MSSLVVFAISFIQTKVKHSPPLSTSQVVTSLALIGLLTTPATELLQSFPTVFSGLGCVRRIQDFLSSSISVGRINPSSAPKIALINTSGHSNEMSTPSTGMASPTTIEFLDVVLDTPTNKSNQGPPINFKVEKGTVTTVFGPVGSGKSIMLKTLLGEERA
jgi:ATP-binding cassette subfamily C (CFTR/MRP) protein 1